MSLSTTSTHPLRPSQQVWKCEWSNMGTMRSSLTPTRANTLYNQGWAYYDRWVAWYMIGVASEYKESLYTEQI